MWTIRALSPGSSATSWQNEPMALPRGEAVPVGEPASTTAGLSSPRYGPTNASRLQSAPTGVRSEAKKVVVGRNRVVARMARSSGSCRALTTWPVQSMLCRSPMASGKLSST